MAVTNGVYRISKVGRVGGGEKGGILIVPQYHVLNLEGSYRRINLGFPETLKFGPGVKSKTTPV